MPADKDALPTKKSDTLGTRPFMKDLRMLVDSTLPEISSNPHILRWIVILILAALGYTIATVGMKLAADRSYALAAVLIVVGFLLVIVTEVFLLRRADMTIVYVTIIGVETVMILAAGAMMGEVVDFRRVLGAGFVVAGIALASS